MESQYTDQPSAPGLHRSPNDELIQTTKNLRTPSVVLPLWAPLPIIMGTDQCPSRMARSQVTDAEKVRLALSWMDLRGVRIFGPLDPCTGCGFGMAYEEFIRARSAPGLTALFWRPDDEMQAFNVQQDSDPDGRLLLRWSPNLVAPMALFACGDVDLIQRLLRLAGLSVTESQSVDGQLVLWPSSDTAIA